MQSVINNSNTSAGRSPNEVIYGFTPNFTIDYMRQLDLGVDFPKSRVSTSDALDFTVMNTKYYYN